MNETSTPLPLDVDLNTVDTSFPLIENGAIVDCIVDKVESFQTKSGSPAVKLALKTTSPCRSTKGDELVPGVTVFHNINLAATGKAKPETVVRNIAEYAQAVGFTGKVGEFINGGFATTQGRPVRTRIAFIPEGPDKSGTMRRAKNEISSFIKQ